MTDTIQTDIGTFSGRRFAPANQAKASVAAGHLFGPMADFLALGGGSLVVSALLVFVSPNAIPASIQWGVVIALMIAINQPHFAHSYQMFYRDFATKAFGTAYPRALRVRYILAGIVVPVVLIAFLAGAALVRNVKALGLGANLMFFLVGWHYVKQGYGILIVDSVQKRLMFSPFAKAVFRANAYCCWGLSWLALNHALAQPLSYMGIAYQSVPMPALAYQTAIALVAATSALTIAVFVRAWLKAGAIPVNGVLAYGASLYAWIVFVQLNPMVLALTPTFHSLQYLAVVWRYQLNRGTSEARSCAWLPRLDIPGLGRNGLKFALFVAAGLFLGYLGFMAVPQAMDALIPYDKALFGPTLFAYLFYIVLDVHHYFLDNVMWRRGNPDVQRHLFSRAAR